MRPTGWGLAQTFVGGRIRERDTSREKANE